MAQTVIGIFDNAAEAQEAVQQLVKNGFSRDNIDVAARGSDTGSTSGTGYNTGSSSNTGSGSGSTDSDLNLNTGSGFGSNTGSSSNLGDAGFNTGSSGSGLNTGSLGTDTGYNTGSPTNTGYTSGDAGFNTGGLTTGGGLSGSDFGTGSHTSGSHSGDHKESGISRFFKSLFGNDDDEVSRYSNVAERSGSIVTVHVNTKDEAEEAADILDDAGAVDVDERASQYGYSRQSGTGTSGNLETSGRSSDFNTTEGTTSIPIIEENLEVGKRTVERGGVRLKSRIVEREVEENLRLREERVWLERNTVDRAATEADFTNFREGTVELTEQAEVPVVNKQARVVEEVSLGKEVDERDETVRGTVRKTEVDVENLNKTDIQRGTTGTSDDNSRSSL